MPQMTDLELAYNALNGKRAKYSLLFRYADGDQPLIYSTDRLREAFERINARFVQNWCGVVINSVLDRLVIKGWDARDDRINQALDRVWLSQHIGLDAHQAHYGALVTGEAFVFVWREGDDPIEVYYNDPRMCHVFYDPQHPKIKRFAAKWWEDDDKTWRMNLYYSDRIEYYRTKNKNYPSSYKAFEPGDVPIAPNPYDVIPVFHIRGKSELANILTLQDAINKLFADMMIAAEFGAFPQRWIISQSDTSALKNAPNEIWELPAGDGQAQDTQVGQFAATDLGNYLNGIDKIAHSIGVITRTPKSYFMSTGANVSGEALVAMEAPLIKKVKQIQEAYSVTWQDIGTFIARLLLGVDIDRMGITPVWEDMSSVQPLTEAQAREISVRTGIPLLTQLRREGWGTDEINQMLSDRAEEDKIKSSLARALLEQARRESDQSNYQEE